MLIICHDAWVHRMDDFVSHKGDMGITAEVVGVDTIGNDHTLIKDYIRDRYNTSDLAFVLLVGDAEQVDTPSHDGGAADPTYSQLTGSDSYPEIMIGRFSARARSSAAVDQGSQSTGLSACWRR